MRTPKENAEGYKASSAFTRADKLHGNLLLVHGMADDNVHFQNLCRVCRAAGTTRKTVLICRFIPIAITEYTVEIPRQHLYTRLTNFLLEQFVMADRVRKPEMAEN